MLEREIPNVVLKVRVWDDAIGGDNPFRWADVETATLFASTTVVLFGLPSAFTPTCTTAQCPAFERSYEQFRALGVDDVYCVSVNDAFVMFQWGRSLGLKRVKLLPDGNADFKRRLGMLIDKRHLGFGLRSWRYAAVVRDGIVVAWFEESGINDHGDDEDPYLVSTPDKVLEWLRAEAGAGVCVTGEAA